VLVIYSTRVAPGMQQDFRRHLFPTQPFQDYAKILTDFRFLLEEFHTSPVRPSRKSDV
jgi:hypothetical protein